MISAVLFIAVGLVIGAAAVLAVLATVDLYYLSGSRAIADDGLVRGGAAPAWSLPAATGTLMTSPPSSKPLQLLVFADHSLKSFPSVVEGLRALAGMATDVEIVVLTRHESRLTGPTLEVLGLGGLPIVTGSPALYGKYNVRVMPFCIVVDSTGRVRASSLVNHAWQVEKLWRLARVEPEPGELAEIKGSRRRLSRMGVQAWTSQP